MSVIRILKIMEMQEDDMEVQEEAVYRKKQDPYEPWMGLVISLTNWKKLWSKVIILHFFSLWSKWFSFTFIKKQ